MARKPNKEKILEAIQGSRGIKTNIAIKLKVCRQTIDNWLKSDEELMDAYNESFESFGDELENNAADMAMEGSERMTQFLLKTKYKTRGYTETVETKDISDRPMVLNVMDKKDIKNMEKLK